MRTNNNSQCVISDIDVIRAWLNGKDIQSGIFEQPDTVSEYNTWAQEQDYHTIEIIPEDTSPDYVERCVSNWYMPDEYKSLNIHEYLLSKCTTYEQTDRVKFELLEYDRRGMIDVLRFLIYLVNVSRENNIVLGVGRGSSVASYCLFLMGVHKIDSLKYKLDIGEFLK